jgi:hypothetical protein
LQGREYLRLGGARAGTVVFKTLLSDVPRLARIVEGNKIDTALNDEDALELLKRLKYYYGKAYLKGAPADIKEEEFLTNFKSESQEVIAGNLLTAALEVVRSQS